MDETKHYNFLYVFHLTEAKAKFDTGAHEFDHPGNSSAHNTILPSRQATLTSDFIATILDHVADLLGRLCLCRSLYLSW